jgi:hypothetical protein
MDISFGFVFLLFSALMHRHVNNPSSRCFPFSGAGSVTVRDDLAIYLILLCAGMSHDSVPFDSSVPGVCLWKRSLTRALLTLSG